MVKILSIALSVFIIVFIGIFAYDITRVDDNEVSSVLEYNKTLTEYQTQIQSLRAEINNRQYKLSVRETPKPGVVIAVKPDKAGQLTHIRSILSDYGYILTLVLNVDLESEVIDSILTEASGFENISVMLCGNGEGWLSKADSACEKLKVFGLADSGIAYFDEELSDADRNLLENSELKGYSMSLGHSAVINTDIKTDGLSQIDHVVFAESNGMGGVVNEILAKNTFTVVSLEMSNYVEKRGYNENDKFDDDTIVRIFERLHRYYILSESIAPVSLAEHLELCIENNMETERLNKEFEEFKNKTEAEIQLLWDKINALEKVK